MKKKYLITSFRENIWFAIVSLCVCFAALLVILLVHNFLGIGLLGQLVSVIVLLIVFMMSSKIFFNVDYSNLFQEIKLSKDDYIDKLLVTIIISLIGGFICTLIYQIDFIIDPDKTKLVNYFIDSANYGDTYTNNSLDILVFIIVFTIGVVAEEMFFRYSLYKVFVKKNEDIIIFIILSSIIFGLYHTTSISRFFASAVLGFSLASIYVITKNVVYAMISHLLWNFSTPIASCFIYLFKSVNISTNVLICGISVMMTIFILILLCIYSYYKRGYIIPLKLKYKE